MHLIQPTEVCSWFDYTYHLKELLEFGKILMKGTVDSLSWKPQTPTESPRDVLQQQNLKVVHQWSQVPQIMEVRSDDWSSSSQLLALSFIHEQRYSVYKMIHLRAVGLFKAWNKLVDTLADKNPYIFNKT